MTICAGSAVYLSCDPLLAPACRDSSIDGSQVFIVERKTQLRIILKPRLICSQNISIFHGCMVWIEKSVMRVTDQHHSASREPSDAEQ